MDSYSRAACKAPRNVRPTGRLVLALQWAALTAGFLYTSPTVDAIRAAVAYLQP